VRIHFLINYFTVTIIEGTEHTAQAQEETKEVFIQIEGEPTTQDCLEVNPSATLQYLRSLIQEELEDFSFEFQFLKRSG
jgi:hypothetical protein